MVNLRPPEPHNPQYYDIPKSNEPKAPTIAKNSTSKALEGKNKTLA
jgi:hypothetical protein